MLSFIPSFLLAFSPLLVSATLQVTQPTAAGWKVNSTVTVTWTWSATDKPFSIEVGNPNIHQDILANGPIAVASDVEPNFGAITFELPVFPLGQDYFCHFVNVANSNQVYASSPSFPIFDNPRTTTISSLSTSQSPSNQTQTVATSTDDGPYTILIFSTSTYGSSPASTSKKNGAALTSFRVNLVGLIYAMFVVFGATAGGVL